MAVVDSASGSSDTGLFYEILNYEFDRASRYNNAVTLMFIKFDQLNEIGRNYGQLAVSRIIWEVERLIRDNIRRADRGFVYGQDEFMIILPNTPKEGANRMIPKLKQLIEHHLLASGRGAHISPQFGIASYPHDVRTGNGVVNFPAISSDAKAAQVVAGGPAVQAQR